MLAFPSPVERRSIISEACEIGFAWYRSLLYKTNNKKKQHPFPFPIQPANFMHPSMSSPRQLPQVGEKVVFHAGVKSPCTSSPRPLCYTCSWGLTLHDRHIMTLYDQNGQNCKRNLNGNHVQKSDVVIPFQSVGTTVRNSTAVSETDMYQKTNYNLQTIIVTMLQNKNCSMHSIQVMSNKTSRQMKNSKIPLQ